MLLSIILWLMIWGGMFTGPYNITGNMFSTPLTFFQGGRAFLPLLALYICIMWMILLRIRIPSLTHPVGLFFYYGLVGMLVSFLSPEKTRAIYWGGVFLAPLLAIWLFQSDEDPLKRLRVVLYVNYFTVTFIMLMLYPDAMRHGAAGPVRYQVYNLPLGLGDIRANGVGRFALVVLIVAFVRVLSGKKITRYLWLGLLLPAVYLLMQSQSRTALLGLAVAGVVFVLIQGTRWQMIFAGPVGAYILYMSGYKWRAKQHMSQVFNLTGRQLTWEGAINLIKESPFFGWGFHADRIMLESQHIHNSYIHALIQSGIIGFVFFLSAVLGTWYFIIRQKVINLVKYANDQDKPFLIESLLLVGALTARSLFESTAAFYGVDLLLFIPAVAYIFVWTKKESIEVS